MNEETAVTSGADTVSSFIECIRSGDATGAFSLLAPSVVVNEPPGLPWSGEFRGLGEVQGLLRKVFEAAELTIEDYEVTDCGPLVLLRLTATFTTRTTGASTRAQVVELYETEDGRITSADVYYKNLNAIADLFSPADPAGSINRRSSPLTGEGASGGVSEAASGPRKPDRGNTRATPSR